MTQSVAIIGAGVIGLTTGIRLLESGMRVKIFARDITEKMASRAAPALWDPYKAGPEASILKWAAFSLEIYRGFSADVGVQPMEYLELNHDDTAMPMWSKIISSFRELKTSEMPAGYKRGFLVNTYLIDTSVYIDYLKDRFEKLGGKLQQQTMTRLTDVDQSFKVIINCSGIGSFDLVPDPESFPIRGQYLLVEKIPEIHTITIATLDPDNYILIAPRAHDCYIGGTTVKGDWNTEIDPVLTTNVLERAQAFEPSLQHAKIIHQGVGLRPGRKTVRLEKTTSDDDRTIIHNYGHGGAGITVSWGCAEDVLQLLQA